MAFCKPTNTDAARTEKLEDIYRERGRRLDEGWRSKMCVRTERAIIFVCQ